MIKYTGCFGDYSGYGEANRHDVAALLAVGVEVSGELVSYVREISEFGSLGKIVDETLNKAGDYRIKILHITPDQYPKFKEPGKYHIGRLFWETDKVPKEFADALQMMDEIWTGSEANVAAMQKAGVTRPIKVIPQAIETEREWPERYDIAGFNPESFLFYSIFEWIDRKNPEALLSAYWEEFQDGENVGLLIKSYRRDFSYVHKQEVMNHIRFLKQKLEKQIGKTLAPIFLYGELMDRRQVMRLHKTGNCFVSAHRGEGWGLPQVEAMLAGNPVISTGYGGAHEYLIDGTDALILNYTMRPLIGMAHSTRWYTPDQNWAEVDVADLRRAMRSMYNDREFAQRVGKTGQDKVKEIFNLSTVGSLMAKRISEIEGGL